MILNYLKYGDHSMKYSKILINNLKKNYNITFLNSEYIIIKNICNYVNEIPFSSIFNTYKVINSTNTKHNIIKENNQKIIHVELLNNIHPSFGIYFPIYEFKYGLDNINNCILKFDCKTDKDIKIKIYNGTEWIKLDNNITNEYTEISIKTNFIFNTKSTYRIGFYNVIDNTNIYIKNVLFEV